MKNYVNVRIQSCSNSAIKARIKHNLRSIKTNNIDTTKKAEDRNIILINPDLDKHRQKTINQSDKNLSKEIFVKAKSMYDTDRQEHKTLYKANNPQNLRETHSSWLEVVITFSEAIDTDLENKYSMNALITSAKQTVNNMAKALKTKALFLTLHLDEVRPHFHIFFKNYGDKGQSIMFENRTRDKLSALQDIAYDSFKVLGMQRGIKKSQQDCGVYDYQKTSTWKAKELYKLENSKNEMIKTTNKMIVSQEKVYSHYKDEILEQEIAKEQNENDRTKLKSLFKTEQASIKMHIRQLKEERALVTEDVNLSKQEKKQLHTEISKKQNMLRGLNQQIKDFQRMSPENISDLMVKNLRLELDENKASHEKEILTRDTLISELEQKLDSLEIKGVSD